jgi:TonB family protein
MKYVSVLAAIAALLFVGCSASRPAEGPPPQLELISVTSLPTLPTMFSAGGLKLNVMFRVVNSGDVAEVKFVTSSGDPEWDQAAVDSMKQWRFTSWVPDGLPAECWVRNTCVVQIQEPCILTLGQLSAPTKEEADSLYALLEGGTDFDLLAKELRPGTTEKYGSYLGTMDISRYPQQVRVELRKLGVNGFTPPIRVGSNYMIYKRYSGDGSRTLPQ